MIPRPCLDCGVPAYGTRCPTHERLRQQVRNADPRRRALYNSEHRRRSRIARRLYPCAICGTWIDTTWDHEHGQVECRRCNSSHRRDV